MKNKILGLVIALMLLSGVAFAAGYTSNASSVVVTLAGVTGVSASKGIAFAYPSRNLYIKNYDDGGIWVNLNTSADKGGLLSNIGMERTYIAGEGSLELYDFMTEGITVFIDKEGFSYNTVASPITVIVTY